jgi:hypothetical protein
VVLWEVKLIVLEIIGSRRQSFGQRRLGRYTTGERPFARLTPVYARQALCRTFFIAAHGKAHTAAICTAKEIRRALFIARTANIFVVRQSRLTVKKKKPRAPLQTAVALSICRAPCVHDARQSFKLCHASFSWRTTKINLFRASSARRTAKNGTIAVSLFQRTAKLPFGGA